MPKALFRNVLAFNGKIRKESLLDTTVMFFIENLHINPGEKPERAQQERKHLKQNLISIIAAT